MQKKLIALAIAGLASSAAFAQTNVTIYGILDASLESVSAEDSTSLAAATATTPSYSGANRDSFTRVNSNSSYVGFKGTEDLGDGLKAIFQFETGFDTDKGTYSGSGRDTFVGLNGNYGTVKLGQFSGPTRVIGTTLDLLPGRAGIGTSDSLIGRSVTATGSTATVFDTRTQNTIQYLSPNFNGFTFAADYAAGENKNLDTATNVSTGTIVQDGKLWEVGLTYADGPWYVAYAYGHDDFGTEASPTAAGAIALANTLETWTSHRLGIGYTFAEGHKINLIFDRQEQDLLNTGRVLNRNTDIEKDSWSLQGLYKVSPAGSIILAYTRSDDADGSFLPATAPAGTEPTHLRTNSETGAQLWTLGYLHALSKRTTLKAVYTRLDNDDNVLYDFAGSSNAVTTTGSGLGAKIEGIALGLRHAF